MISLTQSPLRIVVPGEESAEKSVAISVESPRVSYLKEKLSIASGLFKEEQEQRKIRQAPRWFHAFIHPTGGFRQKWDAVIALSLIYTMAVVPYRISFSVDATGFGFYFERAIDILFMLELVVNFCTGLPLSNDKVERRLEMVALSYLRFWFWLDLLASFPFWAILEDNVGQGDCHFRQNAQTSTQLRLLRVVRVVRIIRLVRLLQLKRISSRWNTRLTSINKGAKEILKFSVTLLCLTHITGCLFFYSAALYNYGQFTWVHHYYVRTADMSSHPLEWTACDHYSRLNWYFASMYWAITTISTVGYGDITPWNDMERGLCIFTMLVGATFYAFIVGSMTMVAQYFDPLGTEVTTKMQECAPVLTGRAYPKALRANILEHYLTQWKYDKLYRLEAVLRYDLSHTSQRLLVEFTCHRLTRAMPAFFADHPQPELFWTIVGTLVRIRQVREEAPILIENTPNCCLYMLVLGRVTVKLLNEDGDCQNLTYHSGSFFGEISALGLTDFCTASVVSDKYCEVAVFDRHCLQVLQERVPAFVAEIRAVGLQRLADKHMTQPKTAFGDGLLPTPSAAGLCSSPNEPYSDIPPSPLPVPAASLEERVQQCASNIESQLCAQAAAVADLRRFVATSSSELHRRAAVLKVHLRAQARDHTMCADIRSFFEAKIMTVAEEQSQLASTLRSCHAATMKAYGTLMEVALQRGPPCQPRPRRPFSSNYTALLASVREREAAGAGTSAASKMDIAALREKTRPAFKEAGVLVTERLMLTDRSTHAAEQRTQGSDGDGGAAAAALRSEGRARGDGEARESARQHIHGGQSVIDDGGDGAWARSARPITPGAATRGEDACAARPSSFRGGENSRSRRDEGGHAHGHSSHSRIARGDGDDDLSSRSRERHSSRGGGDGDLSSRSREKHGSRGGGPAVTGGRGETSYHSYRDGSGVMAMHGNSDCQDDGGGDDTTRPEWTRRGNTFYDASDTECSDDEYDSYLRPK